jgi:hypothetical protein
MTRWEYAEFQYSTSRNMKSRWIAPDGTWRDLDAKGRARHLTEFGAEGWEVVFGHVYPFAAGSARPGSANAGSAEFYLLKRPAGE